MSLATYYRLSLLLPLAVGGIALVIEPTSRVGTLLIVGLPFYGPGYLLFAVAVLFWLRHAKPRRTMHQAAFYSPVMFAPVGGASIVVMDQLSHGIEASQALLPAFAAFGAICGLVAYAFVLPVYLAGILIWPAGADASVHAA